MDIISNSDEYDFGDFDDVKPIKRNEPKMKQYKKSLFMYFVSEFNQKFIVKDIVNLTFAYAMTKYVIESSNPFVYVAVGIIFLNAQNAVIKYFINK